MDEFIDRRSSLKRLKAQNAALDELKTVNTDQLIGIPREALEAALKEHTKARRLTKD